MADTILWFCKETDDKPEARTGSLLYMAKDDRLVVKAACTHDAACLHLSDVTLSASSDRFSSQSGDEVVILVLDKESATVRELLKLEWRVKNFSTAGCGFSSLAEVVSSE